MRIELTDKKSNRLLMRILVRGEITAHGRQWIMSAQEAEELRDRGLNPGAVTFGAFGEDLELTIEEDFSHPYLKRIINEGLDSDDPKKLRGKAEARQLLQLERKG